MPIVFGGHRITRVSPELAAAFRAGDSLLIVQNSGELLHVPEAERALVESCVGDAAAAFAQLGAVSDDAISAFFEAFAARLADDAIWRQVEAVNREDVVAASARGRSTTRLQTSAKMRKDMIDGLRGWIAAPSRRGERLETVEHEAFRVELMGAALGVVGFVFEGRPNVLADATGVLRGGNAVVFRIGSDALGTARALMQLALTPALEAAGLPRGSVVLVPSAAHAAGWALFSDPRLGLAVARGSGPAVATLGALAQQAGVPVSLHGTGGAWLVASEHAQEQAFEAAVFASLDRKVCNTLNVCCIVESRAAELVPAFLRALERAGKRTNASTGAFKLHIAEGSERFVPSALFEQRVSVQRARGAVSEPLAEALSLAALGEEWEWEQTPEVSLVVVRDVAEATDLCNRYSPHFVATLISSQPSEHAAFYAQVDAPFVGDGFTRWVDGQLALRKPELGLSNWQYGRLFGRGGILSGDTVYTVRTRYVTRDKT
ncbi:MAG TPA: aldehyde dehydrogenase family protein [Polyangiales bacterium]|nr:aldehyde dehydrogenase family protein [Polyangiales bacterium]